MLHYLDPDYLREQCFLYALLCLLRTAIVTTGEQVFSVAIQAVWNACPAESLHLLVLSIAIIPNDSWWFRT